MSMWKKFVVDYLTFSRRDRMGVLVLVGLIVLVILLPYYWPDSPAPAVPEDLIHRLDAQTDSTQHAGAMEEMQGDNEDSTLRKYPRYHSAPVTTAELFPFDPNILSVAGWRRLGVPEKTINTIGHYLAKGGKFHKPEDLAKIYGLRAELLHRLLPYVRIQAPPTSTSRLDTNNFFRSKPLPITRPTASMAIDINIADTAAFIALPGIGTKLAARIIRFREKLGGFYAVEQVGETFGLPDSTMQKIAGSLRCKPGAVKQININTSDAAVLKEHPYIRWNLANAIVQFRTQHGPFKSTDDLLQISFVTPELLEKLRPYIRVQDAE